jgi:peroxiredoxin Q/BCP
VIEVGTPAPDFESTDSRGQRFRLFDHRGKNVILYFFPKAFTAGCTVETKRFADLATVLAEKGVEVVGVSVDSAETQTKFAAHCGASFPLIDDSSRAIARSYGVLSFTGTSKRVTFFIDGSGIVRDAVASILPGPHVSRARERFLSTG